MIRFLSLFLVGALGAAAAESPPPHRAQTRGALGTPSPVTVTGKLALLPDKSLALKARDREIRLSSKDEYITAILGDERLLGREMQALGRWEEKDRRLEVQKLYTLHNGKPHEITYYCETCNIWSSKPGPCVCCQQTVDLHEIPLEELQKTRGIKPQR